MKPAENSLYPINRKYDEYRDRCDVEKAFKEYFPSVSLNDKWDECAHVLSPGDCISFALFFAERVKGGAL